MVETGPLHYLIDEGDWEASLPVGLRPAVFVEVKRDRMKGFIVGGSFLADGYQALGGPVPGIEANERAAKALLKKISSWGMRPQSFESKLYQDLYDFERGLGDILLARIPSFETALLKEAELRELIESATLYWSRISDLFDYRDVSEWSRATSALPAGARRYLSHPIRLNFESEALSPTAVEKLSSAAQAVRNAKERLRKRPE